MIRYDLTASESYEYLVLGAIWRPEVEVLRESLARGASGVVICTERAQDRFVVYVVGECEPSPGFAEGSASVQRVGERHQRHGCRVHHLESWINEHLHADWRQRGVFGSVGGPLNFDHFAPPAHHQGSR